MGGGAPVARDAEGNIIKFPSRFTFAIFYSVALAGFTGIQFGFDNGLTGGVSNMPSFYQLFFPQIEQLQQQTQTNPNPYCLFDDPKFELYTSCAYLTGMVAAPLASLSTQNKGRKLSFLIGGALYLIGACLQCSAYHVSQLYIGRLVLGLGVGFVNQVAPLYINEIAPAEKRGTLNILYQFSTTLGIFIAQLINFGTEKYPFGYRISLGVQAFPGLVILIGTFFIVESPNSLVERGKIEDGRKNLKRIRGVDDVEGELQLITDAAEEAKAYKHPWKDLYTDRNAPQATIAWAIPFFQQFTGINIVMFYAPQIFTTMGQSERIALEHSIILGLTNFIATFVALALVDRVGRRLLFIEAGIQMTIAYAVFSSILGAKFKTKGNFPVRYQKTILTFMAFFVAGYAWSWGPLTFLVPPEVFTLETRAAGQAVVVGAEFLFSFVIAQAFLSMLCHMTYGVFLFFMCWVIVMTIFVYLLVPETKGIPLEEVNKKFRKHWFWGKIVRKGAKEADEKTKMQAEKDHVGNGNNGNSNGGGSKKKSNFMGKFGKKNTAPTDQPTSGDQAGGKAAKENGSVHDNQINVDAQANV